MFETGFAANTADLLNKIRIFLTATLPVTERWTQLRYITTTGTEELILQGNGDGTQQIIIGFKHYYFISGLNINSELIIQHFSSYSSGATFEDQAGGITILNNQITLPATTPTIFVPNTMKYWFMGNSRRFMTVLKVGAYYMSAYLGFIQPYATPKDWNNPICIGGSGLADFGGTPLKFTDTSFDALTAFWNPRNGEFSNKFSTLSTLMIKNHLGSQRRPYNYSEISPYNVSTGTFPYVEIERSMYGQYNTIIPNPNYHLIPIQILDIYGIYGEFEGIRFITGSGLNAEDTITVGSDTWLCVPNVNLLSPNQWAAFKLV